MKACGTQKVSSQPAASSQQPAASSQISANFTIVTNELCEGVLLFVDIWNLRLLSIYLVIFIKLDQRSCRGAGAVALK
jgi:hypothetical protein